MKKNYIYNDEKSNKFWSIELEGSSFTVNYGKVGTTGQTQTKDFDSDEEAKKQADKLIAEKIKKGYKAENDEECDNNSDELSFPLTKTYIEKALKKILNGLKKDEDDYIDLFDEELFEAMDNLDESINTNRYYMNVEDALAIEAVKYKEFFPTIRKIINEIGNFTVDGEWPAGAFFAGRLAFESEEDIELFAKHLGERDLGHEADPYSGFGISILFSKYGYNEKTYPVVMGTLFAESQHRYRYLHNDELSTFVAKDPDKFLALLAKWAKNYVNMSSVENAFEYILPEILEIEDTEDYDLLENMADIFIEMAKNGKKITVESFKNAINETFED